MVIKISKEPSNSLLNAPAVTICVDQSKSWKNQNTSTDITSVKTILKSICNPSYTAKDVANCMADNSYNSSEIIENVLLSMIDIENDKLWTSDISIYGQCHTLQNHGKVGVNIKTEAIHIIMNHSLPYRLTLHDLKFFFHTMNPLVIPQIEKLLKIPKSSEDKPLNSIYWQYISATKHISINRPDAPCEEGEDYSFTDCVKSSVVRAIGCKPPWDNVSENWQECTTKEEIYEYFKLYLDLSILEQEDVIKTTGCQLPCKYMEYVDVGQKNWEFETENNSLVYGFTFATTQVTIEEEIYFYPFDSFLAEFGGALGMFLGFSFFMVWDFIKWVLVKYIFRHHNQ